ncbi:MAG TPA: 20S proteasome subunit A/B [Verrucomicrobiae bacterium]|nr:20S proteasome subunit A/B [Verrucomicrobiae bacterium]
MTEEPYRWLEAIGNRREYIRDQLKGGTPVFAVSRPEGIFLFGIGQGMSKVFEIYDRHAFAALGHPVDIEKVRQSAIEAAHLEGFNRSTKDVTLRRLIGFALSPSLKNSFEQIFSPPLMVEAIFAELGETQPEDILCRLHYDGNHHWETSGVLVAHTEPEKEKEAHDWLVKQLASASNLQAVAGACLAAWRALTENKPFAELTVSNEFPPNVNGKHIEAALLDRSATGSVHYRPLSFAQLK